MNIQDYRSRIDKAIRKRDDLVRQKAVLDGRREAAKAEEARIKEECKARNIDPEKLDEVIQKLKANLDKSISAYEAELDRVAQQLAKYQ